MKGIGDLFVIRLAGNVLENFGLGSVEYAIAHLKCKLIMVMGHTACGAIAASLEDGHDGYIGSITTEIKKAIGKIRLPLAATKANVRNTIKAINSSPVIINAKKEGLKVVGSVYHTQTGKVEIIKYKSFVEA